MLDEVQYLDEGVFIRGRLPLFLKEQVESRVNYPEDYRDENGDLESNSWLDYDELGGLEEALDGNVEEYVVDDCELEDVDWHGLAKGRHTAVRRFSSSLSSSALVTAPLRSLLGRQRMRGASNSKSTTTKQLASSSSMRGRPRDELDELLMEDARSSAADAEDDEFDDSKLLDFDAGDYYGLQAQARAEAEERRNAEESSNDM
jgi:hypothetical protein